ncbi:hypothetical protein MLD38_002962 [Melastoma candidum]|uniref:Uncharacterized protein n=1 Tax=Melastoma candidum TaxID=119954 RepID=A0ACB9S116_9MYRT|nr:hypothetical protein MLD38_002962 [Melastoma candidum]
MERDGNLVAGRLGRSGTTATKKRKEQGKGGGSFHGTKKGFSDEQIRLLETMFETETKPEPMKKVELARELGLQPRQVAIWFQNRRARWKSKKLEKEYRVLKCNYDKLLVDFESLKKERQSLLSEFHDLSCMLGRACGGNDPGEDDDSGSRGGDRVEHDVEFIGGHDCFDRKWMLPLRTQDGTPCKVENSTGDRHEVLDMAVDEDNCGSTAGAPEKWCNFVFDELSDYSCTNENDDNNNGSTLWWNFCA